MTQLVPVSQWVYALFKVDYYADEAYTKLIRTSYFAASCDNHLVSDIEEAGPWSNRPYWYAWDVVADDVGHPRVIGQLYGRSVYESGRAFGERLAKQRGLTV